MRAFWTSVLGSALCAGLLVATAASPASAAEDSTFTIAVIGDTQGEVLVSGDTRFAQRTAWLAANKAKYDIRFAIHTGDLVNWGWLAPTQYSVAKSAMKKLSSAGIPYQISIGNHDTRAVGWSGSGTSYGGSAYVDNPECVSRLGEAACNSSTLVRQTQEFNDRFTAADYGAVAGVFESGKVDNSYSTFSAAGAKWLVLNLEFMPRTAAVSWARGVVKSHPHHQVIVQTHAYLNGDGSIGGGNDGYGANTPRYLYDNLIKLYPNIRFVFSGHTGFSAHRTDKGVKGNTIHSYLFNQVGDRDPRNPVRLVKINTATGTASSQIYSPATRKTVVAAKSVRWRAATYVTKTITIGTSVKGRPIKAYYRGYSSPKRVLLVIGQMHGNERAGVRTATYIRDKLKPKAGTGVWVIPTLNPDGYASRKRTNAHGVDLNRNFPTSGWVKKGKGTSTYSGASAGSEPETKAMVRFLKKYKPTYIASIHQPLAGIGKDKRSVAWQKRLSKNLDLKRKSFSVGGKSGKTAPTLAAWYNAKYGKTGRSAITIEYKRNPSTYFMTKKAGKGIMRAALVLK